MEATKREMICIGCPKGCSLVATVEADGTITVTGNTCGKGEEYAVNEITDPRRMVTYSVRVSGGRLPVVSVKTDGDIPKDKIMKCVEELKQLRLEAPVHIGDIVCRNVADTGIDVIATKNLERGTVG